MIDIADSMPLGHDGYLKVWALACPKIDADYILLDEAQDTNAVVLEVLERQNAQIVYVGDKHQQIYEWRGAVNAIEKITACNESFLTQSFRFGEDIALVASRVLATLGEQKAIRGNPRIASRVIADGISRTVLARTNATVMLEVLEATQSGQKPYVCGGTKELKTLLSDVYELKRGKPGICPEFFGFLNWSEVVEFSETEEGQSLQTFIQLVEQHGEGKLWAAVKKAVEVEDGADVILSTAHKAKGREWDSVRLTPDFMSVRLGPNPDAASEVRLFYVAMTRAKALLIVDSEMLRTFTTDAWKQRRAEPNQRQSSGSARPSQPQPQPPPEPVARPVVGVREINPPDIGRRHPSAATQSAQQTATGSQQSQSSPELTPRARPIEERVPESIRKQHPAASQSAQQAASGPLRSQSSSGPPSPEPAARGRPIEERVPESIQRQHPAAWQIIPRGVASRPDEKTAKGLWGRISHLFRK
jgi:hypothetical protein